MRGGFFYGFLDLSWSAVFCYFNISLPSEGEMTEHAQSGDWR